MAGNHADPDKALRSGLWPLARFQGRTGKLLANVATTLYDGPSTSRKALRDTPKGTPVTALMEVNRLGHIWFVTDRGEWGYAPKWVKV